MRPQHHEMFFTGSCKQCHNFAICIVSLAFHPLKGMCGEIYWHSNI